MRSLRFLLLALPLFAASADTILNVQLDTSGLTAGDPYYMDFQFIGNDGNTVNLGNFSYGGGAGPSGPFELDTIANFFNEVTPGFTAGSELDFTLSLTDIAPPLFGVPDELSFFLLDSGFNVLSTNDTLADALFYVDIPGGPLDIQTFSGPGVGPADVTPTATPEPGTLAMLAVGLGLVGLRRPRSHHRGC